MADRERTVGPDGMRLEDAAADVVLLLSADKRRPIDAINSSVKTIEVSRIGCGEVDMDLDDESKQMASVSVALVELRRVEADLAAKAEELMKREADLKALEGQRRRIYDQKMLALAARERHVMETEIKVEMQQRELQYKLDAFKAPNKGMTTADETAARHAGPRNFSWTDRMKAAAQFVAKQSNEQSNVRLPQ